MNSHIMITLPYVESGKERKSSLRTCSQFSTQLNKVISEGLFDNLLTAISDFLYSIRYYFLLYLLTFCILGTVYLTYGMILPLDLLHIRSRLGTSVCTPLELLTNKQSPTDTWYFKP